MQCSWFHASGLSATGQNKHGPRGGWGAAPCRPLLETPTGVCVGSGVSLEAKVCRAGENESRLESALLKYHGCGREALRALRHLRSFPVWGFTPEKRYNVLSHGDRWDGSGRTDRGGPWGLPRSRTPGGACFRPWPTSLPVPGGEEGEKSSLHQGRTKERFQE